jgi:hypothetical protein
MVSSRFAARINAAAGLPGTVQLGLKQAMGDGRLYIATAGF